MDSEHHQLNIFPLVWWNDALVTFRTAEQADSWPDTAAAALLFGLFENRLLLVDIEHRGWSIPGGHINDSESLEQALVREAWEEAGASVSGLKPFGLFEFRIDQYSSVHTVVPCYIGNITHFEPIPLEMESRGIMLVPIEHVQRFYYMWDPLLQTVFQHLSDQNALSR